MTETKSSHLADLVRPFMDCMTSPTMTTVPGADAQMYTLGSLGRAGCKTRQPKMTNETKILMPFVDEITGAPLPAIPGAGLGFYLEAGFIEHAPDQDQAQQMLEPIRVSLRLWTALDGLPPQMSGPRWGMRL